MDKPSKKLWQVGTAKGNPGWPKGRGVAQYDPAKHNTPAGRYTGRKAQTPPLDHDATIKHLDSLPPKEREAHLGKMPKEHVRALYDHMADEPGAHKSAGGHGDLVKTIAERTGAPAEPTSHGVNKRPAPRGGPADAKATGNLQTGAKGGQFYTTATGRKVYSKK